jgi:cytidyltransferase-like protein
MLALSDKKTVMAFGTFDFFHAGHENYLKQAKELGHSLVVVVARDSTVKKVKSAPPLWNEKRRLKEVSECAFVDKAILGEKDDKYRVIKKFMPQILALGYDQFAFTYGLEQLLIKEKIPAEIVRLKPFKEESFKSSILKKSATLASKQPVKKLRKCTKKSANK